jgi:outer membrane receptor protein involved in Fe transport
MELGVKGALLSKQLVFDSSLFHALRRDAQLKFAFQYDPSDPLSFTYLTESVARGESTGLESNLTWKPDSRWSFFANGMAMESNYTAAPAELSSLIGRSYSNAPNWQFSGGATCNFTESLFIQSDMSRQGAFYFDDSNDQKSTPFSLLNLSAGIRRDSWSWTFWWKNVLNENYPVRGFYFGNEPPDFPNKKYVQRGDPSFFGTTVTYSF